MKLKLCHAEDVTVKGQTETILVERTLDLPFAPFNGLTLRFGTLSISELVLSKIVWDTQDAYFLSRTRGEFNLEEDEEDEDTIEKWVEYEKERFRRDGWECL